MDNRYPYTQEQLDEIRTTTSGFYRRQDDQLIFGRFFVLHADYELHRHLKDTYTYPVDGWHWYDSEAEARLALDLPEPITAAEAAQSLVANMTDEQRDELLRALGAIPK